MRDQPNTGPDREVAYVASPAGIFLETGTWFGIREDDLRRYARGVLQAISMGRLLHDADVWLRAPRIVATVLLPLLLLAVPAWLAAVITLLAFGALHVYGPALVSVSMAGFLRVLDHVAVQALLYVGVLSYLALDGAMPAMWVGLAAFVLFRWGIMERVATRLLGPVVRSVYSLPLPDQVLRAVVLRYAIRLKVAMPELADMERSIRDRWA